MKNTNKRVNKVVYAVLTILLGTFGINKFYAGKVKSGILSILFCWTLIPTILSIAEFITVLTEKADKNGQIPVNSERRTNVLFGTSLVIFVLFVIACIIPWESLFTKLTVFTDFNNWLGKIKIGDYAIFSNLIGVPVAVDEVYGSSTGVINAIGSWSMTDMAIFLFIITAVIALVSNIKFNDFVIGLSDEQKVLLGDRKEVIVGIRPEKMDVLNSNYEFGVDIDISEMLGSEKIVYFNVNGAKCAAKLDAQKQFCKEITLKFNTNDFLFFEKESGKRIY